MRDLKRLQIWQRSHHLALDIYKATSDLPRSELYGITNQIQRSAVSIPSNIAEGCGKQGQAELIRYLRIAMGSANELEYQLILSRDLQYISQEIFEQLEDDVTQDKKMLVAYAKKVAQSE